MIGAGSDLAVPAHADVEGWRVLTILLDHGIRFEPTCCDGPGWRPTRLRDVRHRLALADRSGVPAADALVCRDLADLDPPRD